MKISLIIVLKKNLKCNDFSFTKKRDSIYLIL